MSICLSEKLTFTNFLLSLDDYTLSVVQEFASEGVTSVAGTIDEKFLEPVCKIRKEKKGCNGYHSGEISSPLLVTSSNPSELLKAIDKPLNKIALAVM